MSLFCRNKNKLSKTVWIFVTQELFFGFLFTNVLQNSIKTNAKPSIQSSTESNSMNIYFVYINTKHSG